MKILKLFLFVAISVIVGENGFSQTTLLYLLTFHHDLNIGNSAKIRSEIENLNR